MRLGDILEELVPQILARIPAPADGDAHETEEEAAA
jgi:hypothetical protein